jgi:glycosyl transferase family 25
MGDYVFKLKDLKILYVNLDRRPERNRNINNELNRLKLNGKRISAIDGQKFSTEEQAYWMDRKHFNTLSRDPNKVFGRVGCYLSHLKLMKYALDNNVEPLLVLEDDCRFLTNTNDIEIKIPKNCDIYYLGGLYWWKADNTNKTFRELEDELEESVFESDEESSNDVEDFTLANFRDSLFYQDSVRIFPKYFRIACTYSYILPTRKHIERLYTEMLTVSKKAVDMMYVTYVQKREDCYIIQPSLCIQSDEFTSDITDFGVKTPDNPYNNGYFFDNKIYNIPKVIEFYDNNYSKTMKRLLAYYRYNKIIPNPKTLFRDLRLVYAEK